MNIAKITYISLTVLTAWVFMSIAFPFDIWAHLWGIAGSYICVGCSALFASWLSWHWIYPFSYGKYLLCGLLTMFLFHVGLTVGCSIPIIISSCRGVHVISSAPITLWEVLSYILSIFIMSFYVGGLYTLWLCLQTAVITKGLMWIISLITKSN